MRASRIKPTAKFCLFYCISEVARDAPDFDEEQKAKLADLIQRGSIFTGIRVIAWSVTNRTVNVLLYVQPIKKLSDAEIYRRLEIFWGTERADEFEYAVTNKSKTNANRARQVHMRSMGDISIFFKIVNQHFSTELRHILGERTGGQVWHDRHKSRPVENEPEYIAQAVSAIHAAPVRQGLCDKADNYHLSSLQPAVKKNSEERATLQEFMGEGEWRQTIASHRKSIAESLTEEASKRDAGVYGSTEFIEAVKNARKNNPSETRSYEEVQKIAANRLTKLKQYAKKHGHPNVPPNCAEYPDLSKWLQTLLRKRRFGNISDSLISDLDSLGIDWDPPSKAELRWQRRLDEYTQYRKETGLNYLPASSPLYTWVFFQRKKRADGELSKERIKALDDADFIW